MSNEEQDTRVAVAGLDAGSVASADEGSGSRPVAAQKPGFPAGVIVLCEQVSLPGQSVPLRILRGAGPSTPDHVDSYETFGKVSKDSVFQVQVGQPGKDLKASGWRLVGVWQGYVPWSALTEAHIGDPESLLNVLSTARVHVRGELQAVLQLVEPGSERWPCKRLV